MPMGRGKRVAVAAVVVVTMAVVTDAALGAVRYASPTGGGAACTSAAPCRLRTAIEAPAVRAGDEVVVRPGTYNLGANHVLVHKAISVHGAVGRPRPKVTSHDSMTLWVFDRGAVVSDLEVVNTAASGFPSAVWVSDGILERVFAHAAGAGCALAPDVDGQLPLIRDSFCWATGSIPGYGVWWAIGVGEPHSWSARLRNVTAVGRGAGIEVDGNGPVHLSLNAVNTVARSAGARDVGARADSSSTSVRAIFRNSNYATRQTDAPAGGTATVTAPGSGANQTLAPLFRDRAHGDFHQRRGSPTIDAGIDTPLNGARDIDRQARHRGPAPDIGADEIPPG
jgi:hypothetical protein